MTQPLFTDADFCSGRWPVNHAITAPEPGLYVLDHQADFIELRRIDEGEHGQFVDGAMLPRRRPGQFATIPEWT